MESEDTTEPSAIQRKYASQLLDETREDIGRADSKSGMVLAALGIGIGAVLGGLIAGNWRPFDLDNGVEWIWWLGALSAVVAVGAASAAVWPRYRAHSRSDPIHYWGDRSEYLDEDEFAVALLNQQPQRYDRDVEQLWVLSGVVLAKYVLIRIALAGTALALVLCGAAVAISDWLR